jgi:hypothetical protein
VAARSNPRGHDFPHDGRVVAVRKRNAADRPRPVRLLRSVVGQVDQAVIFARFVQVEIQEITNDLIN